MIKAVIFDMDGVLIDARDWHYEALNEALSLFGFEISRQDHLSRFDGLPTYTKLQLLSETGGLPVGLHQLIGELKQIFTIDKIVENCRPQFRHEFALSRLKKDGLRLAVASNSIAATVELMMERANLRQHLEFFLSNEDVVTPKPSPEIYLKAIDMLDLRPREVLIVEDNPNGIAAARASGAFVAEVAGPDQVTYEFIRSFINGLKGRDA